ncbi:nidogen isoform X1 [Neodiprion fabricii]|uniref:nidogen isoform X1 n=2 Tax=Neodiprion fabricii TaxID=2872261 RepID=UPI001ED8CCB9|nr:nidogen isoform X1 [Neodiprion fabricii]
MVTGCAWTSVLLALVAWLEPLSAHETYQRPFYAYALGKTLEPTTDGQLKTVEVKLKTPISFYDYVYDTIYVNGNGVLSFLAPMQMFFNIPFPLNYPVIAPLYTHVDTRGSGVVYWEETEDPSRISQAGEIVRDSFTDALDFYPISLLIVTWENVGYYNAKSDKKNTYQVVISSNGTHSYAEFLYAPQGIQWIQADSHPGSLPDARAQAGVVSRDGRMYTLKDSGSDQVVNLDKWSNIGEPGKWVLGIGPINDLANVRLPDNIQDVPANNEIPSCLTDGTSCHSRAECVDYSEGFCCVCKTGYFGNGKFCQQNDLPLRAVGKVTGFVNNEQFPAKDLQCYVQTKDGRTYTAMSRVPELIGPSSQLLSNLGSVLGWLFAKPIENTKNGYQITGGIFNMTASMIFTNTGDNVTITSRYLGLDVFGQLKMETNIRGSLPYFAPEARIEYEDHDELYTKTQPGTIISQTNRSYKLIGESGIEHPFTQSIAITYQPCQYAPNEGEENTVRLKFSRGLISYEAKEQIIRFAMNTKVAPLEEEDPCIKGKFHCGNHSSCIVEGDDYKCICNPGYQYLYEADGSLHCVDVNECTSGIHTCSPDANCINNEGSHVCQCLDGYEGDGRTCERIPTCADKDCGDYAECTIVEGFPQCSCIWGYEQTDDGCYAIQELNCGDKMCSPYAYCSENDATQTTECICDSGTVGDGYTCEPEVDIETTTPTWVTEEPPIPKCILNQCWCPVEGWEYQDDHTCIQANRGYNSSTEGQDRTEISTTYDDTDEDLWPRPQPQCLPEIGRCICPLGYAYDPQRDICVPQPGYKHETMGSSGYQLSCNVLNICDAYAQCVYLPESQGIYKCQCNAGYEGDGYECRKIEVDCLQTDICDPNATCRPDDSANSKCVCNSGFEGDGSICTPIDECSENLDCGQNQECRYNPTTSRYTCDCLRGFNRVDDVCMIADCSSNPSQCHLNAHCVSKAEGGFTCACISGYNGDGFQDCRPDHVGCNIINNCGRDAVCGYDSAATNYACQCKPGFFGDGFTCLPESSCRRDSSLCSVDATCVPAGENQFTCVCNAGFTGNGADCRTIPQFDSNILLINQGVAMLKIPFFPTPNNPGSPIAITSSQVAEGLDIDCSAGRAYWSDISGNKISSMMYNGSDSQVFVTDVSAAEGIAIDWVSRNAFWTDSNKKTVEVANLDTRKRKVLVSEGLVNPRGITAHPYRGKIFWSDWNRASPKLEWANEDGTGRAIFMQNEFVKLPNSLAIDWSTDELCWADAGSFSLNCANIDTRTVRIVAEKLSYPFGLAISQNHYYWTDWTTHKIEVASKNTGKRDKALRVPPGGSGKLYGIVAVPEYCPRVSNVCQYEFGRCNSEQLCLPDGEGGRTCACADNASGPCTDEYQSR